MPILSKHRNYTFIFLLAVLTAWSGKVWAQSAGLYYFVNGGSGKTTPADPTLANITNPDDYFYLVPADNPQQGNKRDAYYSSDYSAANGDPEKPYLTTYKTKKDAAEVPTGVTNRPHNSVWIVKFASNDSGTDYYHLIHAATGKYVVYEPPYPNNWNRKSVHLLTTNSPGEIAKFAITTNSGNYNFRPKSITSGNRFLNAANANYNFYYSSDAQADGDANYFRGLVGLWSAVGGGSDWKPEATLLDAPTISVVDVNNKVTITDANSLPSGYEIHYTTDGSTIPTASTGTVYSGPIPITANVTIKAVVVRYGMVLTEVATETREPAPCATPVITFDYTTSEVSITCATENTTIYYTTNGSTPTTSSTPYNGAFSVTSSTTVKAIATHTIFPQSEVATLALSQVATPTIQNNGNNAITITTTTPGATIYYTTDGSNPTTSSTEYTGPLTENVSNVTIKAIAVKAGMVTSAVGSGTVMLQCATPVITRDGMTFTLSCSFPSDATLYYSLDGGSEVTYTRTPVSFTSDQLPMTVTAVARHSNYTNSETASFELINGTGTPTDPYLIYGTTDFTNFVTNVNNGTTASACYKLGTDVSASGMDAITTAFTGTFDGNGFTISNLGHALFNSVNGGVVKNVILDNVSISGGTNVGAICNEATGASRIYNCGILATSSTTGKDDDGYDVISSCSSSVSGSGYVGGIVGLLDGSSRVINCFSYANVSGGDYAGGIVGYNNVATTASNLQTMVMNCMFYGEVSGSSIAPIYNGQIITNDGDANGVNNFNYFRLESAYIQDNAITKVYNCALGAETRFLQRFEFFRHLLNSNRELAAWWATGNAANKDEMMKWVEEPTQIGTTTPYPILKTPDKYASVVNYTPSETAYDDANRNKGRKLTNEGDGGVLHVTISMGSGSKFSAPSGAGLKSGETGMIDLTITDKDFEHFNYNYGKVQLPYYNDYCDGNYTGNRVVTGWMITSITGGTAGSYSTGDDVTYNNSTGELSATPYNFADRNCTNKDLYSVSGRVFNQGAYWDVPEGVTAITIQPYWARAAYLSDAYWDVTYKNGSGNGTGAGTAYDAMTTAADVTTIGGGQRYTNGVSTFNGQLVYTSMSNAISSSVLFSESVTNPTVYDYAVVLVGNYHHTAAIEANKNYTVTSVDQDGDNEPDYSFLLRFNGRLVFHPVRYDFLNLIGLGMAQKTTGGKGSYNFGIMQPKAWFEVTNTALFRVTQFEYSKSRTRSPYILQGGVIEQWVTQQQDAGDGVSYFHIGGNVWFKEFHRGSHQDNTGKKTPHPPISVTGGDFAKFYLTGYYQSQAAIYDDNAECYINGGRFGEVAGAGMEGIGTSDGKGNVTWVIDHADIKEFYGGGINAAKPVHGNIHTIISNSYVDLFCGGPKFGDMVSGRTVTTTASDCTFGTYFGAGYGGNSYNRIAPRNHNNIVNFPHNDNQAGNHASWNAWLAEYYTQEYDAGGVSTQFDYQFLPMSGNTDNVARIFVDYVGFSLATTRNVTSNLTGCTITGNFYGGGSLGKVDGDVTSTLDSCTVNGSVFGSGYSASLPTVEVMSIGFQTEPYYYEDLGTYRTGVFPTPTTTYRWEHKDAINSKTDAIDKTAHILYTTEDLTALGTVSGDVTLNITGNTLVEGKVFDGAGNVTGQTGGVFGGGDESKVTGANKTVTVNINQTGGSATRYLNNVFGGGNKGDVASEVQVTIQGTSYISHDVYGGGNLADVGGSVTVTMNSGTVMKDVYGGGALANTNISNVTAGYGTSSVTIGSTSTYTTTVNLLGGTIHGDAYGGGLGRLGANAVEAIVYGDVDVNLGSLASGSSATAFITSYYTGDHAGVVKSGRLFGCNNLNGSPKGDVTVTVYKTVPGNMTRTASDKLKLEETDPGYVAPTYELVAVYGGGNLADFTTSVTGKKANVIIETCDVSIRNVYGGGNAAAVPETNVLIRGAYEIQEVFGGGNGKDPYTLDSGTTWVENPGADINGNANTLMTGGYIHEAYGGSNEKGTVYGSVTIDVGSGDNDPNHCELDVEKIVGAGKNADVNGDLIMVLGCKPNIKVPELYGGADNANVNGDVELTITSGKYGKVFGGNNQGGAIMGHIIVNIEETGNCEVPIEIDELYLGGNEAAYSMYGYYNSGTTEAPVYEPRTSADDSHAAVTGMRKTAPYAAPVLNIISCTRIGKMFGGGYGMGATMYADPTVNINMIPGSHASSLPNDVNNPDKLGLVGDVYGGGNEAAVHGNTTVNIGTLVGQSITLTSTGETATVVGAYITGTVYGAGKGKADDPDAAIVKGNTLVNMAGGHVRRSIYGGGELGSVGTFTGHYTADTWDATKQAMHFNGEPNACEPGTGLTKVLISGGQVGLVNQLMPNPNDTTANDDYGYVFCASKGVADSLTYAKANILAVTDSSYLEISGGTIAASVYGGSENGEVLRNTHVKITGGQIGTGHYRDSSGDHWDTAYTDAQWSNAINAVKSGDETLVNAAAANFHQCDAWPFGPEGSRHVYDHYHGTAGYDSKGGGFPGSDGHSFFGHVFGGGSGFYPFAAGKWRRTAGRVIGNTFVEITGGHILTNVYGGNEITDVLGHSKVVMKAGTVGVPRTNDSIQARPVNCYIFGAGMGDPRVLFNGWSNVASSEVIVDSVAVVFGSVFGGGEDGHVLGDVTTTIKGGALIGTLGTSGVDGNIFGSGRGFSAIALTAGVVCGNVTVNVADSARILGSVFGGGRMAAVGTHLAAENTTNYGVLIPDGKEQVLGGNDVNATGVTHGHVTVNITGGTIGNLPQMGNSQFSIGDVYGGSKGIYTATEWAKSQKLGLVKNTTVNISQATGCTTKIYGSVYGGGEIASVGSYTYYVDANDVSAYNANHPSEPATIGDVKELLEANTGKAIVSITGGTLGQNKFADIHGNVFGGCLGKAGAGYSGYSFVNTSDVTINGGTVYCSVFGGGENGHVLDSTYVKIQSGTVGIRLDTTQTAYLHNNMIYRGNVYGGGRGVDTYETGSGGHDYSITAGKVSGNTRVEVTGGTIYRCVYGGGSLASVGIRDENDIDDGLATVIISGGQIGSDGGASANNYNTVIPDREARRENGYVYGSGRGMSAGTGSGTNETLLHLAYTKNTKVYIQGTANVTGSVFGGGENGHVKDSTKVYVRGNCFVGTELNAAEHEIDDNGRGRLIYRGNVYGGGRGIDQNNSAYSVTAGRVYGNTFVEVSGGKIYHDVFGGGSLASVGNETINGNEVTYGDESGQTKVVIKGGVIGYSSNTDKQGFNCGFVYGGCRGLAAAPTSDLVKMAYVHETQVFIEPGADIKGSVFGGGANGHVKNNTQVTISGGSIGTPLIESNDPTINEVGFDSLGVAVKPVFRGNVYAGGRGVDQYNLSSSPTYSLSAGAVYGNATLLMTGGHVWHNVYGSGAMASVGTVEAKPAGMHVHDMVVKTVGGNEIELNPDTVVNYLTGVFKRGTGAVRVTITGGTVGDTIPGHEGRNNGRVYGAGRGVSANRSDYTASMEYVDSTFVTIGTSGQQLSEYSGSTAQTLNYPYIYGSVFGGGENGHVKKDTDVKIYSGIIGFPLLSENGKYNERADGSVMNPHRGHVYGGGRGVDPVHHGVGEERSSSAGRVYGHTNVTMTGGVVRRAIYGGGLLASVGVYKLDSIDNYHIKDIIEDNESTVDAGSTTINITGGYVGNVDLNGDPLGAGYLAPGNNNGFVFGSSCGMVADDYKVGQDSVDIQYRQMGYAHSTLINISNNPHIYGCVFGSGENGHVWEDARINIKGGQIGVPTGTQDSISTYVGNVYGSGRGVDHPHQHISETAGKVRGNTTVNIKGGIVWRDVYGGGSLASVGEAEEDSLSSKRNVTNDPTTNNPFPYSTGLTRVVLDSVAVVHGSVYGSGRGVASADTLYRQAAYVKNTLVTVKGGAHIYNNVFGGGNAGHVRRNTDVTIADSAKVDGSVYGGGAGDISSPTAGLVNHDVAVNIKGGVIAHDVYGGGAIANSNVHDKRNDRSLYTAGTSAYANASDYGKPSENAITTTKVNLTGGIILGDAYGGGQGVIPHDTVSAAKKANAAALVQGDVTVTLNGTAFVLRVDTVTATIDGESKTFTVPTSGRVFGCNNLNGTPQGTVLVKVLQTKGVTTSGTAPNVTYTINNTKPTKDTDTYEVEAVYGGGNLAAYDPWDAYATGQYSATGISATERPLQVVIEGCDLTSIKYVYGGGNAASVPSTQVLVKGAYEIGNVFGGGNGKDNIYKNGAWAANPGANVGYHTYPNANNDPYDTKENRIQYYSDYSNNISHYGSGKTWATIFGGTVHSIYGGSNTKGNVRVESVAELDGESDQSCTFDVGQAYGGGRSADQDGEAKLIMNCIVGLGTAYGGAENADVLGGVELNIINGTYDQVFGGNNRGGRVAGAITVNIEETGCNPIIIGELYGGGNLAPYSVYGYKDSGQTDSDGKTIWQPYQKGETGALSEANKYASPVVNVKSFTSIGNVFGGGYGQPATMVADPTVNINTVYGRWYDSDNSVYAGVTKTIGTSQVTIPAHEKGKLGAIQNVFGGGNEATVVGNTNVNIGTLTTILFATDNPVTTTVDERTEPQNVIGVNILGNVYGGGNHADVTGNTNVVIGQ